MKKAIGLLEFKSIAKGMQVTDEVLKSSNVELVMANPICPGKYVAMVTGDVGAVNNAVAVGMQLGGVFQIEAFAIPNVHPDVFPALSGCVELGSTDAIGVIETMSALSSVLAADTAVKASNVQIVEIRLARGLGGKGFTILAGDLSAVRRAVKACEDKHNATGDILCATVIPTPTPSLLEKLFT